MLTGTQDAVRVGQKQARRAQGCPQHIILCVLIPKGQGLVEFGSYALGSRVVWFCVFRWCSRSPYITPGGAWITSSCEPSSKQEGVGCPAPTTLKNISAGRGDHIEKTKWEISQKLRKNVEQ